MNKVEQRRERQGFVALLMAMMAMMVLWNQLYVQPHEQTLLSALECTKGNASEAAFRACTKNQP